MRIAGTLSCSIVDGKFEQDKLITGKMYGSSNQRIIDIKKGGLYYE